MKVAVFSTKAYDRSSLQDANTAYGHALSFFEPRLTPDTRSPDIRHSSRLRLAEIAQTTLANITAFEHGQGTLHQVSKAVHGDRVSRLQPYPNRESTSQSERESTSLRPSQPARHHA